jgi:phosphoglycerate dehydrogenase-like enzyme
VRELGDCRALIVGAGGIGSAIAQRLTALGVRCVGVRRRPELGAPDGFARVVGTTEWETLLPETELLILSAPATSRTCRLVTASVLDRLPRGAIVVNVSRGSLLDEVALAERIERGALRGAVLDVFAEEPLPPASPLWSLPSVLVTPHVSGVSPNGFWDRELSLFIDNWHRYAAGRPLRNVVDKTAGY